MFQLPTSILLSTPAVFFGEIVIYLFRDINFAQNGDEDFSTAINWVGTLKSALKFFPLIVLIGSTRSNRWWKIQIDSFDFSTFFCRVSYFWSNCEYLNQYFLGGSLQNLKKTVFSDRICARGFPRIKTMPSPRRGHFVRRPLPAEWETCTWF